MTSTPIPASTDPTVIAGDGLVLVSVPTGRVTLDQSGDGVAFQFGSTVGLPPEMAKLLIADGFVKPA